MKITIKEYASSRSISPQAVYQAIAKGKLKSVIKDGKKFVVVDAADVKPVVKENKQPENQKLLNDLLKQLKQKDKEIKRLNKQLIKCGKSKEKVLLSYIQEIKQLKQLAPPAPVEDRVIDVVEKKKKKHKK